MRRIALVVLAFALGCNSDTGSSEEAGKRASPLGKAAQGSNVPLSEDPTKPDRVDGSWYFWWVHQGWGLRLLGLLLLLGLGALVAYRS